MKTKAIILIAVSAVISLSFAFINEKSANTKKTSTDAQVINKKEATSGFLLEDKL